MAALVASPGDAVAFFSDTYFNRKLGLALHKPDGWSFVDIRQMGEVKSGQIVAEQDEELAELFHDAVDLPFACVCADERAANGFASAAQFYLVSFNPELETVYQALETVKRGLPPREEKNPLDHLRSVSAVIRKLVEDAEACDEFVDAFEVLSPLREFRLSGCEAAEYTASYLFEHRELATSFRVRVRTVYVLHRNVAYLIRLIDSPASGQVYDFDSFLEGIYLV